MTNAAIIDFSQSLVDTSITPTCIITESGGKHTLTITVGIIAQKVDADILVVDLEEKNNTRDVVTPDNVVLPGKIRVKLMKLNRKAASSTLIVESDILSKVPGTGVGQVLKRNRRVNNNK